MRLIVWTLSIVMLLGAATGIYAANRRAEVLRRVVASTVVIYAKRAKGTAQGSGTVLGRKGDYEFVLTCHHVIEGAGGIILHPTNNEDNLLPATIEVDDPDNDLTLLVVYGLDSPILKVAKRDPEIYDTVYAVGAPFTEPGTASEGIITSLAYEEQGRLYYRTTNAFIAGGISGGTATNTDGDLIGVPAMGLRTTTQYGLLVPRAAVTKARFAKYYREWK